MKHFLPFISYVFHPIFTLLYGSLLYFFITNSYFTYQTIYFYLLQILIVSVFIPLLIFYFLISSGKIDSIMVFQVAQRKIPLYIQIILVLILMNFVVNDISLFELSLFYVANLVSCIICLLLVYINKKASLHMVGIASITIYCAQLYLYFGISEVLLLSFFIALTGLVATSRLFMKAHSFLELLLGFFIGVIPQAVIFYFSYKI